MIHLIGTLITVASIAGLGVIIEGATDARRRLRAWARARQASPSREGRTTKEDRHDKDIDKSK